MFAAESLVRTLINQGVDTCFTNPGTSEMHMVAALDRVDGMKSVLCLFEGVATGAADGYARMSGKPAATLLHLGPGAANGLANLHNARRAHAPVVNIVGDHAQDHLQHDAPLTSDIEGVVAPMSRWVGRVTTPGELSSLAVEAVRQSHGPERGIASLVLPADCAWSDAEPDVIDAQDMPGLIPVDAALINAAEDALRNAENPHILLGSNACLDDGLEAVGRLAEATGAKVFMDTFIARIARGHGRFAPKRLSYLGAEAMEELKDADLLIVAGTKAPVAFFAYPGERGEFAPEGIPVVPLGGPEGDTVAALAELANRFDAPAKPSVPDRAQAPKLFPDAELNPGFVGISMMRHMPEDSIICDDATTSGMGVFPWISSGPRHDWLCLTGGSLGSGMPQSIGAALACPERKVFALCGDGAAAYTLQAMWTQARENLNVINVVFANHSYLVLNFELARVGAGEPGPAAQQMLSLDNPKMDWVKISEGFGVPAQSARTAGEFDAALVRALKAGGPQTIVAEI
ncbi:MAG: acetolactate synthase large subunit [Maricaulis sp.]|uniref:acetolactate synthase large subunit n=1 Tax=Maricaulis sp. TaxID=1486257 RepID=UPI00261E1ABB|nr:acetolactate synthase large subunit [Maricaulis sp.]MDM7985065.1 acetolactate synthase large subunit [Maricaulis sp.]